MNYRKIYDQIIERGRSRVPQGYVERHHIIPECMGGSNLDENLVALYPEEHFLAHILLVKIFPENRSLICAVQKMTVGHEGKRIKRKLYGWLKRKHAAFMRESQSGTGNSQFGTRWICIPNEMKNKKIGKQEPIPEGWVLGRNKTTPANEQRSHLKGLRWYNDGVTDFYIHADDPRIVSLSKGRLKMVVNQRP